MSSYTPRRASLKRWLEDAPPYILDVFDSKGSGDRYTVFFTGYPIEGDTLAHTRIQFLGMDDHPTHPQGISQWGEMSGYDCANYRYKTGKQRIRWLDLPEAIRQHVISRAKA